MINAAPHHHPSQYVMNLYSLLPVLTAQKPAIHHRSRCLWGNVYAAAAQADQFKHMQAHKQEFLRDRRHVNINIFMTRVWINFGWGSVVFNTVV